MGFRPKPLTTTRRSSSSRHGSLTGIAPNSISWFVSLPCESNFTTALWRMTHWPASHSFDLTAFQLQRSLWFMRVMNFLALSSW